MHIINALNILNMTISNSELMSKIEEKLADRTEPILGFRPSSKLKRGRIGFLISIICLVIVVIELIRSGVI